MFFVLSCFCFCSFHSFHSVGSSRTFLIRVYVYGCLRYALRFLLYVVLWVIVILIVVFFVFVFLSFILFYLLLLLFICLFISLSRVFLFLLHYLSYNLPVEHSKGTERKKGEEVQMFVSGPEVEGCL